MSKARSGENSPWYGKHHTKEEKKKISEALSGKNSPLYGKHPSLETRKKLSKAHKLYYEENPKIQSGENNPFYGKHHTKETRKKISRTMRSNNALRILGCEDLIERVAE